MRGMAEPTRANLRWINLAIKASSPVTQFLNETRTSKLTATVETPVDLVRLPIAPAGISAFSDEQPALHPGIGERHGLPVIEDAAEAIGSKWAATIQLHARCPQ